MFTEKAQAIINLAKDCAHSAGSAQLDVLGLLGAMGRRAEPGMLLAECCAVPEEKLAEACPEIAEWTACPGKLPLAEPVRALLQQAKKLADQVPDPAHPGLIDLRHLVGAVAMSPEACDLLGIAPLTFESTSRQVAQWHERDARSPRLDDLTEKLHRLRAELAGRVFGQEHAIGAFVEGLFEAEVVAAADASRRRPRGLFVFAGPPGVGKTLLAELGASFLDRPFKRFDMSAYSGHYQDEALVGMAKSYRGAHPGVLTEFVEKNPDAVLLFDEIEKAHLNTIHLFLQVLDAGTLEDKYHERNVAFRDTTIIFTTNAGRKLYDRPNANGVHAANSTFHRRTILDALENERDPRTGEPFFPAPICSRMGTGYPVLFNYLRVNELEQVVRAELRRVMELLQLQYYKRLTFDDLLPMALVLREGGRADARTLCAQAAAFVKTEMFKFCRLFHVDRLEESLNRIDQIHFRLDEEPASLETEVRALFESQQTPRVLLVADPDLAALYRENVRQIDWLCAATADEALELLADKEVDALLLDLWLGQGAAVPSMTIRHFDYVPAAARGLGQGQELLRKVHERLPALPVYLLSLAETDAAEAGEGSIDDQLFLACVRAGGARGMVVTGFVDGLMPGWQAQRDRLAATLVEIARGLYRQRTADRMAQERKVLSFDTAPHIDADGREVAIRLRNLRLGRAVAAADAGEILEDVQRPTTHFADVIGAEAAKDELAFFVDYLKNPRRFAAMGLKPPKGVLLFGPPGTGKTMLARAMAGESDVAFLSTSATAFVTIWQGSGPQNVRDLFERARRYAPAIVFIDELDAIGAMRAGTPGAGRAEENTLNALLTEMDGFTNPSPDRPVFVLAATNFHINDEQHPNHRSARTLDPALVRRFSRTILIDLPERPAREKYLSVRLTGRHACNVPAEIIRLVAERSSGMSIANLELIIETAARNAAKANGILSGKLLEEAFEGMQYGEARAKPPEEIRCTACHEAGHTILYWLSGYWPPYVTVVARGGHGGYMARAVEETERCASQTREELLASIRVSLAGRAAETLVIGPEAGLSTGASADLEHATSLARRMICRYGMDDRFGLVATPELLDSEAAIGSPLYRQVIATAGVILREQMARTVELLTTHRQWLDLLAQALAERERLTAEELRAILPERVAAPRSNTQAWHRPPG